MKIESYSTQAKYRAYTDDRTAPKEYSIIQTNLRAQEIYNYPEIRTQTSLIERRIFSVISTLDTLIEKISNYFTLAVFGYEPNVRIIEIDDQGRQISASAKRILDSDNIWTDLTDNNKVLCYGLIKTSDGMDIDTLRTFCKKWKFKIFLSLFERVELQFPIDGIDCKIVIDAKNFVVTPNGTIKDDRVLYFATLVCACFMEQSIADTLELHIPEHAHYKLLTDEGLGKYDIELTKNAYDWETGTPLVVDFPIKVAKANVPPFFQTI